MELVVYPRVFHCVNPKLLCLREVVFAINAESYIDCVSLFIIATHDLSLCDATHHHLHVPVLQLLHPLVLCLKHLGLCVIIRKLRRPLDNN
jgi:hypothetical protein